MLNLVETWFGFSEWCLLKMKTNETCTSHCRNMSQCCPVQNVAGAKTQRATEDRKATGNEAQDSNTTSLEDAVLENSSQFHRWHSEMEAARALGTEVKYQHYADTLKENLGALEELQSRVSHQTAI